MKVDITVNGPVGSGKSAIMQEIVGALRAVGVKADAVGQTPYDVGGDPVASLEIYRESISVEVHENVVTERSVEERVGGSYEMPDGRQFWVDGPVAREIARRVLGLSLSSKDHKEQHDGR